MSEEIPFYIICPCNCGRAIELKIAIEDIPAHDQEEIIQGIPDTANRIWQGLVNAMGLEGTIQFLHKRSDTA